MTLSTQTFGSVARHTVGQYHQAGEHLLSAYQHQVQCAAGAFDARFASAVQSRDLPLVNPDVKASLIAAQRHLAALLLSGLASGTSRAVALNDRLAETANNGIERGAALNVKPAFAASAVDSIATLAMPAAQLGLSLASMVSQRVKQLGERAEAVVEDVVAEPPAAAAAPKRARASRRAA